jgi:hypothetical protein
LAGETPAAPAYFVRFQTIADCRPLVVRGIVLVHSSPARLTVVFISVPTWFGKVLPRMW